jgi:(p)ppGpp synthase/HD superfamily hydrolase
LIWSQDKYIKAYRFASEAHIGQPYSGTNLPYLYHIGLVSMEVISALIHSKGLNEDLAIQCALLHDVIEDTDNTYMDIENAFGKQVADGVLALTKNPNIEKEFQMINSLARIKEQPIEVWMVKLADRITNLAKPPSDWGKDKIINYREEAKLINKSLGSVSDYLQKRLATKIDEYKY